MEKKTILAIVLSALVYLGFYFYNTNINNNKEVKEVVNTIEVTSKDSVEEEVVLETPTENLESNEILDLNFKTELFDVTFNTEGANIKSLKLLNFYLDGSDKNVDLVNNSYDDNELLNLTLGNYKDPVFNEVFSYNIIDKYTYEFSTTFTVKTFNNSESKPLTLIKTYKFLPNDYMFELKISIKNSENSLIPINSNGSVYALRAAKQIGPEFQKLDRRQSYRRVSYNNGQKRKELKAKKQEAIYNEDYSWVAIEGKFFTFAIIPEFSEQNIYYTNKSENKQVKTELYINRDSINSSFIEDTYKIYAGPKSNEILKTYNNAESNGWNIADVNLNTIITFWLRPLGMFFMMVLQLLNSVIKNYGISIILLTVIIKIILYPFTRKSIDSMGKMQTIQPEIKKLQDKYKDDSAKLNAAMADLYKKEGVNPLGGCLPMLLQMPIFITFYSLFNEFIGLRGASFIPGWINDLSKPEYILQFGFELPFLGWDALRLLPIIYVASQLISMKFSQNKQAGGAPGASAMQTKMLTLGMPIMFFFIMYNQSSGLLLYWITQNLITSVQQILSKKKSDKEHDLILEEKAKKKKNKRKK